jgi:hypothetical protein
MLTTCVGEAAYAVDERQLFQSVCNNLALAPDALLKHEFQSQLH